MEPISHSVALLTGTTNNYITTGIYNPCGEIFLDSPWDIYYTFNSSTLTINNNNIMQNKVAVFKVTRDNNQKITSSKFLKELWIESKNGSSIDFEVAKDPEISKYEANEIVIKSIYTVTL
jgi:hypothetical protein